MFTKLKKTFVLLLFSHAAFAADALTPNILPIEYWTTAQKVRVYFVATPKLPIVDIRVIFDAGSARDGEQFGLANLTNNLLAQGANGLSANDIAVQFENVGAQYSADVDRDMALVSLRTLSDSEYLKPALKTLIDVVSKPTFDSREIKYMQQQTLAAISAQQQSVTDIATNLFYKQVFGSHPYGHSVLGDATTISAIKDSDIKAFYKKYYVAHNAVIVIVGALTKAQAVTLADEISEHLAPGEAAKALPSAKNTQRLDEMTVPFPSQQAAVRYGDVGTNRSQPDYFALVVGNHILGGSGLNSRLNQEIREKNGLTYGIYSYFEPLKFYGPFLIALETRQKEANAAIRLVKQTLNKFISTGPTKDELEAAKQNLLGGFPLRIDNNQSIASYLTIIGFYQLPLDYLDRLYAGIETMTADKIRQAFQKQIQPDDMVLIKTINHSNDG